MLAAEPANALLTRSARTEDAAALQDMLSRCSAQTRYHRFHGAVRQYPASHLRRLLSGADGYETRVAEVVGQAAGAPQLVAVAELAPLPGQPHVREIGVLVEDAWQRRGIGIALADEIFAHARASGVARIRLELCRARPDLVDFLLGRLTVLDARSSGCDVSVDVDPSRPIPGRAH
jgi:GNAT superfamily N-acetyltransferase